MNFDDSLNFGKVAENEVTRWLIQVKKFDVLPVYEFIVERGKGPRLLSSIKDLIAPDMLAIRDDRIRWVESKRKTHFAWYRNGNNRKGAWNTGIDERHYLDYIEVEKRTGIPVWLFFLHEESKPSDSDLAQKEPKCPPTCPTGLFAAPISWLQEHECDRDSYNRGYRSFPMVYWSVENLIPMASLKEVKQFKEVRRQELALLDW